jgi:hypothetical protein
VSTATSADAGAARPSMPGSSQEGIMPLGQVPGSPSRRLLPPLARPTQLTGTEGQGADPLKSFASAAAAIMIASPKKKKRRPSVKRQSFGAAQPGGESGIAIRYTSAPVPQLNRVYQAFLGKLLHVRVC